MPYLDVVVPGEFTCLQKKEWFEDKLINELPKWKIEYQKLMVPSEYEKLLGEKIQALKSGISQMENQLLQETPKCNGLPVGNNGRL